MKPKDFFNLPTTTAQKQYEALRAFYIEDSSAKEVAEQFGFSEKYLKKLRYEFVKQLNKGNIPSFFITKKTGPKKLATEKEMIEEIIALRKQNYSILDIKSILQAKDKKLALDTIDKILKRSGFAPLPKRTKQERQLVLVPKKILPAETTILKLEDETFSTERSAGPLIFLPLLEQLNIISAIQKSGFPKTSVINDVSSILSFVALKILGRERLSHDETWGLDRAIGLFANLNVLPKNTTLSTYSYRVTRKSNLVLLKKLSKIFQHNDEDQGCFNLDFKSIPHWGDASILEKNWADSRGKAIKSLLALIVENADTGMLSYTDGTLKHHKEKEAILDFVDFWTKEDKKSPQMLIFDSKLTTYENLNKLNEDHIKFLTLRRRGSQLVQKALNLPDDEWQFVHIDNHKRKHRKLKIHDGICLLKGYEGKVRQIIVTGNGRKNPTFLISNDMESSAKHLLDRYAKRWLVEQEIAEQIAFFHLNQPSSSIVVKVDFDLTLSLLVHNLYREISKYLQGFEKCTVPTLYRKFIENGAQIEIKGKDIFVKLKKKTHLPILFELPWLKEPTWIPWLSARVHFETYSTT